MNKCTNVKIFMGFFTSEITMRTFPFISLKFPWKLRLYLFASWGNVNYISGDLEVIFDSILISLVFLFFLSEKRCTETLERGSWKMYLDFPSITGFDFLLLSLGGLQSLENHKEAFICSFSFFISLSRRESEHWSYLTGEEAGFKSTNSPFCGLVTVIRFYQKQHRAAGPGNQPPASFFMPCPHPGVVVVV